MNPKFNLIQDFCLRRGNEGESTQTRRDSGHKTKPRPDLSEEPTGRGRVKPKTRLNRAPRLAGGLLGGALHLLGRLGLGSGACRGGLGERIARGAEDEREAEHRAHDLFHGCFSLSGIDDSRPSCRTIIAIAHETRLKRGLK